MSKSEKRGIDGIVRKAERVIGECQSLVDSVYLDLSLSLFLVSLCQG